MCRIIGIILALIVHNAIVESAKREAAYEALSPYRELIEREKKAAQEKAKPLPSEDLSAERNVQIQAQIEEAKHDKESWNAASKWFVLVSVIAIFIWVIFRLLIP